MALPKARSPAVKRPRRAAPPAAGAGAGALPMDLLFDVLLRLPARDLCRLRAVCRPWRALTSDPLFVAAHAARRHREDHPLFLATFRGGDEAGVHVLDLCGAAVKRVGISSVNLDGGRHRLLPTRLDLACVATDANSCRAIDPATGASYALPQAPAAAHVSRENMRRPYTFHAFGRVPSTGEYKVLRMFNRMEFAGFYEDQLFEVFTVNGAGTGSGGQAQWRARNSCGVFVEGDSALVVGGIVYFKIDKVYHSMFIEGANDDGILLDCIFSFDLEREQWRNELQGPIGAGLLTGDDDDFLDYSCLWNQLSFAELRGSLVLVYFCGHRSVMDLWILQDFEKGLWAKEFSIQTESILHLTEVCCVKSLFVLDDGRLVIHVASTELLLVYDSGTNTFAEVEMGPLDAVAMYTGSLLSL